MHCRPICAGRVCKAAEREVICNDTQKQNAEEEDLSYKLSNCGSIFTAVVSSNLPKP